jgi:hypothetical protein
MKKSAYGLEVGAGSGAGLVLEKGALAGRPPALDALLQLERGDAPFGGPRTQQAHRAPRAGVARCTPGVVLLQAPLRIGRNAGVERAVGTLQQVDVPGLARFVHGGWIIPADEDGAQGRWWRVNQRPGFFVAGVTQSPYRLHISSTTCR